MSEPPSLSIDAKSIMKRQAQSIRKVSIRQLKAARSLLGWNQEDLAEASSISAPTIKRIEASDGQIGGRSQTAEQIVQALEKAGIEFIDENGGGPGVRLKRPFRKDKS